MRLGLQSLNLNSVSGLHQHSALMMLVSHTLLLCPSSTTFFFFFWYLFQAHRKTKKKRGGGGITFEELPCPLSPRTPDFSSEHTQFFLCVCFPPPSLFARKEGRVREGWQKSIRTPLSALSLCFSSEVRLSLPFEKKKKKKRTPHWSLEYFDAGAVGALSNYNFSLIRSCLDIFD